MKAVFRALATAARLVELEALTKANTVAKFESCRDGEVSKHSLRVDKGRRSRGLAATDQ
jgi:hypothetical protein